MQITSQLVMQTGGIAMAISLFFMVIESIVHVNKYKKPLYEMNESELDFALGDKKFSNICIMFLIIGFLFVYHGFTFYLWEMLTL